MTTPRRPVSAQEELAGSTAALLCLSALALLVVATNPFALIFLLPSLHAWLWLPNMRSSRPWARAALLGAGFLGPALVLWSFGSRYGLGWDAPWYVLELRALGYVPFVVIVLVVPWLAGAGQLAALAARRYAPYPEVGERPLGPLRRVIRRAVLYSRDGVVTLAELPSALRGGGEEPARVSDRGGVHRASSRPPLWTPGRNGGS